MREALERRGHPLRAHRRRSEACSTARSAISRPGKVSAGIQGRFEWGPRALGKRSIIADPRRAEMKDIVNTKIKFREPFRPFAPSVLVDAGRAVLRSPGRASATIPRASCCSSCRCKNDAVPAVTHVDGSARAADRLQRHEPALLTS